MEGQEAVPSRNPLPSASRPVTCPGTRRSWSIAGMATKWDRAPALRLRAQGIRARFCRANRCLASRRAPRRCQAGRVV